jgi:hypothetical protein
MRNGSTTLHLGRPKAASRDGYSPTKSRDTLSAVLTRFEGVCLRLENAIESQNLRLVNIEHCMSVVLAGKFEVLVGAAL